MADAGDVLSSHSYPTASVPDCATNTRYPPGPLGNRTVRMNETSPASDPRGHYALAHGAERVLGHSEFGGRCLALALGDPGVIGKGIVAQRGV